MDQGLGLSALGAVDAGALDGARKPPKLGLSLWLAGSCVDSDVQADPVGAAAALRQPQAEGSRKFPSNGGYDYISFRKP